jgi:hypothetical protein
MNKKVFWAAFSGSVAALGAAAALIAYFIKAKRNKSEPMVEEFDNNSEKNSVQ